MWHDKILVASAQSNARTHPHKHFTFTRTTRMPMWIHLSNAQNKLDYNRNAAQSSMQCFSRLILCCAQISTIFLISSARPLTSAEASHAHVVRGYHLLLDKVVPLQRVEGRVPQDDSRVFALILKRQQFLRADGMKCLVRLRDEAGLCVFRRRDTLSMLTTVAWRHKGKQVYIESREGEQGAKQRRKINLKRAMSLSLLCWTAA